MNLATFKGGLIRRHQQLFSLTMTVIGVSANGLILTIRDVDGNHYTILAYMLRYIFGTHPHYKIITFNVVTHIAICQTFFHSTFYLIPPDLSYRPVQTNFRLIKGTITRDLFALYGHEFLFFAQLFMFHTMYTYIFTFSHFSGLFHIRLCHCFFFTLIIYGTCNGIIVRARARHSFLNIFLCTFIQGMVTRVLVLTIKRSRGHTFFMLHSF